MERRHRAESLWSRRRFLRRSTSAAGVLAASAGALALVGCGGSGVTAPAGSSGGGKAKGPVNWLAWSTYANPEIMGTFEPETGIKVNLIAFEDDVDALAKLQQAGSQAGQQFDVVQADADWPVLFYQKGFLEPLKLDEFDSAKTLMPQFRNYKPWQVESGGILQYPNMYSPAGIAYRKDKFPTPPDSWSVMFDPKYKGRMMWPSLPDQIIPITALALGYPDPFNLTPDQLKAVVNKLKEGKPNVNTMAVSSAEMGKAFVSGEVDIGVVTTWRAVYVSWKDKGPELGYAAPKEGTVGWVDGDGLVKRAAHAEAAKQWINY